MGQVGFPTRNWRRFGARKVHTVRFTSLQRLASPPGRGLRAAPGRGCFRVSVTHHQCSAPDRRTRMKADGRSGDTYPARKRQMTAVSPERAWPEMTQVARPDLQARWVECTSCGTKPPFAHAAFADAAYVRWRGVSFAAAQKISRFRPFKNALDTRFKCYPSLRASRTRRARDREVIHARSRIVNCQLFGDVSRKTI